MIQRITDDLHFLPENAVSAPAPDFATSLHCKHEQDDEADKHQEAKDDSYGLQEGQHSTSGAGDTSTNTDSK